MKIKSFYDWLTVLFGSNKFFFFVVGLLVFQALWLAGSAAYPMAFDEDFHLGLIKLYADHPSPFWSQHPANGDVFGPLTRDPSYLFHYLMSLPYQLTEVFTSSQATQVMVLRVINIGLFAWALVLLRRLLRRTGASNGLVNLSLLVFVLVPIVPYLAAQINYDNLMIPLTALSLLYALELRESMKTGSIDTKKLIVLIWIMMFACLVKYAYLPIALALTAYLLMAAYKIYGRPKKLLKALNAGFRGMGKRTIMGLAVLVMLTGVLFVERYGVNVIKYHDPAPDCGKVLTFEECKSYGPWIRDYWLNKNKGNSELSPISFTADWVHGMWFRSFFAISGAGQGFDNKGPLTLPAIGTIVFIAASIGAFILTARQLWRRYRSDVLWLFASVCAIYIAVVWLQVFAMYLYAGKAVAINGRYLLPILPILILVAALATNQLLKNRYHIKLLAGGLVLVCYLWGGGMLTYILRSQDSWYWTNTPLNGANKTIRDTLGPVTPGYDKPTQYFP